MRKVKLAASIILIIIGSATLVKGSTLPNQVMINAGLGGIFIGVVVLSFTTDYLKTETFEVFVNPYLKTMRSIVSSMSLHGKAVYIPPYENMPRGAVFIPASEDFTIDLAKLDPERVFLVESSKEMGLVIEPLGSSLMADFEAYSEMSLSGIGEAFAESASAVLRSLNLAKSVVAHEEDGLIKIVVIKPSVSFCSKDCEKIACPICSSVAISAAKAFGELLLVEDFKINRNIEITLKKLGGISSWM